MATPYGNRRAAWVDLEWQSLILQIGEKRNATGEQVKMEKEVDLDFLDRKGKYVRFKLGSMTEIELKAMMAFISDVYEIALPVVRERDQRALQEREEGDDSDPRLYRAVPRVIIREWIFKKFGKSIPRRLAGLRDVDRPKFNERTRKPEVDL